MDLQLVSVQSQIIKIDQQPFWSCNTSNLWYQTPRHVMRSSQYRDQIYMLGNHLEHWQFLIKLAIEYIRLFKFSWIVLLTSLNVFFISINDWLVLFKSYQPSDYLVLITWSIVSNWTNFWFPRAKKQSDSQYNYVISSII